MIAVSESAAPLSPLGLALLRRVLGSLYKLRGFYWFLRRPFSLGVKVLAFDAEGRVLLVRHTYQPGWHLPGGRVEKGETALECARRELREETGLLSRADGWKFVGLYANFSEYKNDHVALYQLMLAPDGELHSPWFEIERSGFFALDALPDDTTPATRRRIAELRGESAASPHW